MPSVRQCSSLKRNRGNSAASARPSLTPQVNFARLPSIDFSLKRRATAGFIVSTSTVAFWKPAAIRSKTRATSSFVNYIVKPSTITSAGTSFSAISPLQSSMADMAICEIFPCSGRMVFRTAIVSGKSRLYQ